MASMTCRHGVERQCVKCYYFYSREKSLNYSNINIVAALVVARYLSPRKASSTTLLILVLNSMCHSSPMRQITSYTSPNSNILFLSRGLVQKTSAHKLTSPMIEIPIQSIDFWMSQLISNLLWCQRKARVN